MCLVVLFVYMSIWRWKNIYEKHLYDKIPLECEARQCYDADYDDSLSPLTFSGKRSEESSFRTFFCAYTSLFSPIVSDMSRFTASFWISHHSPLVVPRAMARWICNSAWAPRAVCLQIHLSIPTKFCSASPHRPEGNRARWKVWGFLTRRSHSPTPHPSAPGPDPPRHLHPNLKPFIFLFLFFWQCNPESTLPCYSFVWTCEW